MRLAPSILSFDLTSLSTVVQRFERISAEVIHLDVMDGQFVPPITFGDAYVRSLRRLVSTPFEVHLMTLTPERQFECMVSAGCTKVIFHAEATNHAHRLVQSLHQMGVSAGLAINPGTSVEVALALAEEVDQILIMTVNPGWGGQEFLRFTLDKIRAIRRAHPRICIEVDGGIDPTTIRLARDAGADLFVVGSFLANAESLEQAVGYLRSALE